MTNTTEPRANFQPSEKCIGKLSNLEGFRAYPYKDSGGLLTIGFGQRCHQGDYPNGITKAEALVWMVTRLQAICADLQKLMPWLMPHQVDALCLFVYNIGWEAFITSGTCTQLKAGKIGALVLWTQWIHDAKQKIEEGLVIRRQFETQLFVYGWRQ